MSAQADLQAHAFCSSPDPSSMPQSEMRWYAPRQCAYLAAREARALLSAQNSWLFRIKSLFLSKYVCAALPKSA